MKNISETMVDLAYSAILFHDESLVEEVFDLEEKVDELERQLNMNLSIAVRDAEDAEKAAVTFEVASANDKISDASADIAYLLVKKFMLHPALIEALKRASEVVGKTRISENSVFLNETLEKLSLESKIGVDVIAIKRGRQWVIAPSKKTRIQAGDILIGRGTYDSVKVFRELGSGERKKIEPGEEVKFEESLPEEIKEIVDKLLLLKNTSELMVDLAYSALLFNSKEIAYEVEELEEIVDKTYTDLELLVFENRLKEAKPTQLLCIIHLAMFTEAISDAASEIASIVIKGGEAHPILEKVIEESEETIVKTFVSENSQLAFKSLKELNLEDNIGMRVIAIKHGTDWMFNPKSSAVLKPNDIIIVRGYSEGKKELLKLAAEKQAQKP